MFQASSVAYSHFDVLWVESMLDRMGCVVGFPGGMVVKSLECISMLAILFFHILPCSDTMLLVALLVLALGHLEPHPCQGQLLCLLQVERCWYRGVEGKKFCIRVHLEPYRNPLHQG